jgi:ligand-binding SRPBCC domain-containing protein
MPKIEIHTHINAPKAIVFDLSRSIDLHKISTAHTNERAIAGRTSGLIEKGETVTWRAKHLGVYQNLTSIITAMDYPDYFVDEMQKGAFKAFRHEHFFKDHDGGTSVTDIFEFQSPLGILGELAETLFLKKYIERLLERRNAIIKEYAESDKYEPMLNLKQ